MASINKVILVGNLGRDPEVRYMPSGDALANLSIATTDTYTNKQTGQRENMTEWHRVVFFGKTAEVCGQYLKKGSQVYIEGSIRTRKWQDKDGQDRYSTEIRGERMQMLGGRADQTVSMDAPQQDYAPQQPAAHQAPAAPRRMEQPQAVSRPAPDMTDLEDDIPF